MAKCWRAYGRGADDNDNSYYEIFFCATEAHFSGPGIRFGANGVNISADGVTLGNSSYPYEIRAGSNLSIVTKAIPTPGAQTVGNCSGCELSGTYDCINGMCIASAQYKTPGYYKSLSDCQAICGDQGVCGNGKICIDPNSYCPPGKVCLEQAEYSQINALISKISQEICG